MCRPITVMLYFELNKVLPEKIIRNSKTRQRIVKKDQKSMKVDADLYWSDEMSWRKGIPAYMCCYFILTITEIVIICRIRSKNLAGCKVPAILPLSILNL